MAATRDFLLSFTTSAGTYAGALEDALSGEQSKLDSLPESFEGSGVYSSIEEACEMLESAIESLDSMREEAEGLPETLGLELKQALARPRPAQPRIFLADDANAARLQYDSHGEVRPFLD